MVQTYTEAQAIEYLRNRYGPPPRKGIGVHIMPTSGTKGDDLRPWLDRVRYMGMDIITTLNDDEDSMRVFAEYGLEVVCRPRAIRCNEYWANNGQTAETMRRYGLRPWMQPFNEPSDRREWPGEEPNVRQWAYNWIFAAENIISYGGFPGVQCLSTSELRVLIEVIREQGKEYIFDYWWMSVHNYPSNHPPNFPYDGLNSYDIHAPEGELSMLVFLAFAKVFLDETGRIPPHICTEGGWCIGDNADNRYPTLEVKYAEGTPEWPNARGFQLHRDYTVAMFDQMRTGKLVTGELLPYYLYGFTPWLLCSAGLPDGGLFVGGDLAFEENAWYSEQLSGAKTLTIEAVRAIPDFVRAWDAVPTPTPEPTPEPIPEEDPMPEPQFKWRVCDASGKQLGVYNNDANALNRAVAAHGYVQPWSDPKLVIGSSEELELVKQTLAYVITERDNAQAIIDRIRTVIDG